MARAEGFTASIEPSYSHIETDVTSQDGRETHESLDLLSQRYRLSLDRSLTSALQASVGGSLLDERGWRETDGTSSDLHGRSTALYGRLTLGLPTLTIGIGADRRDQRTLGSQIPTVITESYVAFASWRPLDLPELDLRIGRTNQFDASHRLQDTTADNAAFSARYHADRWDARYLLSWSRTDDQVRESELTSVDQAVLGSRTDSLFGGRTSSYLSASLNTRNSSVTAHGPDATVTRQQLPIAGLSAVEAAPATPVNVVLAPNPLLVDGNLATPASVDVGFGPSSLGDRDLRDVAIRFGDLTTEVNRLYVWFDHPLDTAVGPALAATAQVYESIDNQTWTLVTPTTATPSEVDSRLELTLPRTTARYLKVVLRPLEPGITADVQYRDLQVTEVQALLVLPAALVPKSQSAYGGSATAFIRTALLRANPELAHDLSASVAWDSEVDHVRYSVVNGLSLQQHVWRDVYGTARVARQDDDAGRGHEGLFQWSAALTGRPLPTAHWNLTYSGSRADTGGGEDVDFDGVGDSPILANSLSALGRADWYDGISSQVTGVVSQVNAGTHTGQTGQVTTTTSFVPNRWMTFSVGGLFSRSRTVAPELGAVVEQYARVDGSLSLTPAPALSAAGTVSRVILGARKTTLGTMQLNWFPLRGDLQLSFAYSNTLDTAAEATTRIFTPALRWNVRRGVALTTSYTWLESDAPAQVLNSRAFMTTLLITL